jgi:hypothetical protein
VRRLGYELHVRAADVAVEEGRLTIRAEVENRGVAPFYADWGIEYALIGEGGKVVTTWPGAGKLAGILPGAEARVWEERVDLREVEPGEHRVLVRAVNPLKNGKALRFANAEQDRDREGWLTLGRVKVTGPGAGR